ncbi:MAG: GtrA family protein [Alphaproteobacteria bacterium]|nr:GtrA family protein [Alphaproteobacteria bacterium]
MLHLLKSHYKQFRRFSFVGLINTAVDFVVFSVLFYAAGVPYVIAHMCSFVLALTNSFLWNSLWTFKNLKRDKIFAQVVRFVGVGCIGLALSTVTIYVAANYVPVLLAKLLAVGVTIVWNYFGSWFFVFRD